MKKYDVIVIGAGPGGAHSARLLAKNNLNVLLLEKYKIPRIKFCVVGLFYYIDEIIDFNFDNVVNLISDTTIFTYQFRKPVKLKAEDVKIKMTMREDFDTLLARESVNSGVKLIDEISVKAVEDNANGCVVKTNKDVFYSDFVIGADGVYSITARSLGLLKDRIVGWAINAEVYVSDKQLAAQENAVNVEMGIVPNGYAWIFPKKDHLSCGIGTALTKINKFKDLLYYYLDNHPNTKNYKKLILKGHPLPHSYSVELVINTERAVLVGDAASVVDPLSGEGIYYAMKTAEIAVKHILKKISKNLSLDNYSDEINKTIRSDLYYSDKFARLFYKFPKLTYDLGVANPIVNKKFQDLLRGKTTYKEMYEILKPIYSNKFTQATLKLADKIKQKFIK
ncbi:MAG TPA: geranylgeranyl reductase family protein [bacterium]|mgnify:CR=1 FL=1|nr:geranylgeranyl reductase family protein [bacterium]